MTKKFEAMNYEELRQHRLDLNRQIAELKALYVEAGKVMMSKVVVERTLNKIPGATVEEKLAHTEGQVHLLKKAQKEEVKENG